MAKPFEECTIKGKTYGECLKTEEGRGLLRWLIKQPIKDDNFKGWTISRNKWIKEKLELYIEDPQLTEENVNTDEGKTVLEVLSRQIVDLEDRVKRLNELVSKRLEAIENCLNTTVDDSFYEENSGWKE